MLQSLLDLVFAPVCLGCGSRIAPADPVRSACRLCRARLRDLPSPGCPRCAAPRLQTGRQHGPVCPECLSWPACLRAARSACLLKEPADRLVYQLKYQGWQVLAEPLAERMARILLPADVQEETRLVVPVPTTAARRRERGYNQAELLARAFARLTGRDYVMLLERVSYGVSQTALQPAARGANVTGAFRVVDGAASVLEQAHPILVDDVLTTGATAAECAKQLVAAGAHVVSVVTFARALDVRRFATRFVIDETLITE